MRTKLRSARHILPKSLEDDSGKNVDTTQKRYNTTPNGKRIKTNCGSIRESKTQYSKFFLMLVINESIEQVGRKKVDVILWRNKMGGRLPRVYDKKTSMKKNRSIDEINLQYYSDAMSYYPFCRSITPKFGSIDTKLNCETTMMEGHTLQFVGI